MSRSTIEIGRRRRRRWPCQSGAAVALWTNVRGLTVVTVLVLAGSCSTRKCNVDCIQGYEPIPSGCGCRPVPATGGLDASVDQAEGGDSGSALASCEPATGCGAGSTCIGGCPSSAKPSIGSVPGVCSVPGRDTCGCGAVLAPCTTAGTTCLMPACCDYEGICVTPSERAAICARPEGAHFDCSSVDAGGQPQDAAGSDATNGGFAADFSARARAALAAAAPSWTCATSLPNVPVADAAAAREAVGQFIAQVVGVPVADIMVNVQTCNSPTFPDCAVAFAHDTAKSGGSIYSTADPLASELEANATSIEDTIWEPMQNGLTLPGDAVMSGIAGGTLVGMVVFNAPYACQ